MSRRIRTSFGVGSSDDAPADSSSSNSNSGSGISPTSVMDFHPSSSSSSRNHGSKHENNNNNNAETVINQLKRQVTALEHEKASLEQELLNQINTVVFDKETMVTTLQEKLMQSEERYKAERQAHANTRSAMRQERFANVGDIKFELFKLQDQVLELTTLNENLKEELEQLYCDQVNQNREKQHDEKHWQTQLTILEENHQVQFETYKTEQEQRIEELEQSHAAVIADLERDFFQRYQEKLQQVQQGHQGELEQARKEAAALAAEQKRTHNDNKNNDDEVHQINQELLASLQETNHQLLQQVSELSSQLLEEQTTNFDLQSAIDQSNQKLQEASTAEQQQQRQDGQEVAALCKQLAKCQETEQQLRESIEEQTRVNTDLRQALEAAQQQLASSLASFEVERGRCFEEMVLLKHQLEQEKASAETLQESMKQQQQQHGTETLGLKMQCSQYMEELDAVNNELEEHWRHNKTLQESLVEAQEAAQSCLKSGTQQQEDAATILRLRIECASNVEETNELEAKLQEQIDANASMKTKIKEHKARQETLESRQQEDAVLMSKLHAECNRYAEEIKAIQQQLALEQHSESFASLVDEKQTIIVEIGTLHSKISDLEASLTKMEGENTELQSKQLSNEDLMASLQEEVERLTEEKNDISQELEKAKLTEKTSQETVRDKEDEIMELRTLIESKDETIVELENEIENLREEIVVEQSTISTLLTSLGEEENANSVLHERQVNTSEAMSHLKSSLEKERATVRALQDSLSKEESAHSDLLVVNEKKNNEMMDLQKENVSLIDRVDTMVQEIEEEQEMIQSLQASLEQSDIALADIIDAKKKSDEELLNMTSKCSELDVEAQALRDALKQEQLSNEELKATMQMRLDNASADFEKDRVSLLDRIGTLREELSQSHKLSESYMISLEDTRRLLSDLQDCRDEKDDKILAQEKEVSLLRDKNRQLRAQSQKHFSLMNILKASLQGSHRVTRRLEEEQTDLLQRLDSVSKQLDDEHASTEKLNSCFEDTRRAMEEQIASLRDQIQLLEDHLTSLNNKLQQDQSTMTSLENTLAEKEQSSAELLEKVERQNEAMSIAKAENADLFKEVQDLQGKLKTLTETNVDEKIDVSSNAKENDPGEDDTASLGKWKNNIAENKTHEDPEDRFDAIKLKSELSQLKQENAELRDALNNHLELKKSLAVLEAEKRDLLEDIRGLQIQLRQKQLARSDSMSSIEEHQKESILKVSMEEKTTKDDKIEELNLERETLLVELETLRTQVREAQMPHDSTQTSPAKAAANAGNCDCNEIRTGFVYLNLGAISQSSTPMKAGDSSSIADINMVISQSSTPSKPGEMTELAGMQFCYDETARKEIERLETELISEKTSKTNLEAERLAQKETIKALERDLAKAEESLLCLEDELSNLKRSSEQKATESEARLKSISDELESTKEWLEPALDEVEDLREKIFKSTALLRDAEDKNQEYRVEIERLESDLFDTKQSLAIQLEEIERLQDRNTDKEAQNAETRSVVESFKAAAEHWRREAERLKASKEEIVAKQMERESKLKLAYKREVGDYKKRVEEFEAILLEENQKLRAEIKSEKQSCSDLEEKAQKLSEEVLNLREQVEAGTNSKQAHEEEIKKLCTDFANAKLKIAEADKLADDLRILQKEKELLQERLEDYEADKMEKMLLEIEEQKEVNKLKVELTKERRNVVDCKAEIQKLCSAVDSLKKKCQASASKAEAFQQSTRKAEEALKSELQKAKHTSKSNQTLKKEMDELQRQLQKSQAVKVELLAQFREKMQKTEEAFKWELQKAKSYENSASNSNENLKKDMEQLQKDLRKTQAAKVELEAQFREKICLLEEKQTSLLAELEGKKREISKLRSFFCDGEDSNRTREDLQIDIKELTEKTIVQGRIIHTLQKKIDTLELGKEKFFEAKRKEIMRDHSEQQSLRKENTRLREKVREVTEERKALQAQLESFATSLGLSMVSHLRKGSSNDGEGTTNNDG